MFSRFFKPRFYTKCKSYVNTIKTRLETIKRKRKAVEKFLKNDIAELLQLGLDFDAYRRAAGLLLEYNMSSCYELVEKFIGCILDHLEDLSKQKDCPDECKEAVPSLIYAAARFSDLPELRELRTLFTEKYGNSLEPYISKEFVEKLRQDLPAREKKIQLMNDIAEEFSVDWDSMAWEQQLYRTSSVQEERTKYGEWSKNNDGAIPKEDERRDFLSQGRKEITIDDSDSDDDTTSTDMSSQDGPKASSYSSSVGSVSEDEVENKRPFYHRLVPPPYFKPRSINKIETDLPKSKPRSVRRSLKSNSLPPPQSTTMEASKGHQRATSMASEMPHSARHVHPKLPDYDDLATRLRSIKGR
ncbi:IST1-like protein [Senna tora]|uniref:IST1-like protein n=1 Tax=Senna tora TaxID=362788 RepID=A0A834WAG3_9FABA|nr:IST1-like protein [Senna tora]